MGGWVTIAIYLLCSRPLIYLPGSRPLSSLHHWAYLGWVSWAWASTFVGRSPPIPLHRFPMTKYDPTDLLPRICGNQIRINEGLQNRPLDPWKSKTSGLGFASLRMIWIPRLNEFQGMSVAIRLETTVIPSTLGLIKSKPSPES